MWLPTLEIFAFGITAIGIAWLISNLEFPKKQRKVNDEIEMKRLREKYFKGML